MKPSTASFRPRRLRWGMALAGALVAALACAGWWMWRHAAPSGGIQAGGRTVSVPLENPPRTTDFPWDAQLGSTPADAPVEPQPRRAASPFEHATTSMEPPPRPVWQMLRGYRGPHADHAQEDAAMLAALSWCENRRGISDLLGEARSQGALSAEQLQALDAQHTRVAQLCVRLSDRDYGLRTDILRLHARAGDTQAQLSFVEAGPAGRWRDTERESLPLDDAQLAAWREELLGYLRQAASVRPGDALSVLAFLYDPGTPVPLQDPVLGPMRDIVQGHAFRLLWIDYPTAIASRRALTALVQHEEARLTAEQLAQARLRAELLRREWQLPPPEPSPR